MISRITAQTWRAAALGALWVQVASVLFTAAYALWRDPRSLDGWLSGLEALLAALALAWWTALLGRLLRGQVTPPEDGTRRALSLTFPWLTALRLGLWGTLGLALLAGAAPEANPVALTALMTVWFGAIVSSNAVFGTLVRLSGAPGDPPLRQRLREWLNLSAALAVGMTVLNVVPVRGFSGTPELGTQLVYGLGGLLDVLATVLALRAVMALGPGTAGAPAKP
ncbi:hypothetical protein [uncultured Deinococcus sp.]|uniref:hypothetical protein n=1 Tax=uncultured Deinococcus sp. TaxID=158789 RepID=UPI0037493709